MTPAPRASVPVLLVTLTINIIGIGLLMPVLPQLIEELAGDISSGSISYGLIVSLYAAMQFLFGPLLGALSDRFGRRPVILFALAGLGIHYLLLGIAPTLVWIAIVRAGGGMMGASISAASAYIADITAPERRAQAFGLIGVAFGVGFIIGPVLGGLLGEIGLRVPFYVAAGLCAGNLLLAWRFLPESLKPEHRSRFRWRDANPIGAFVIISRYAVVVALMAVFAFTQFAERALESTWVLFTDFRFGWGPAEVGISLAAVGLLIAFTEGVLVRIFVPRFGEARMLRGGLVVGGFCMVALAFATEAWMAYAAISLYVVGWGVVGPAARAMASRAVGVHEQGILQGAITSLTTATGIIGPPIAAGLFGYFVGPSTPVIFAGAPYILAALLFVVGIVLARQGRIRRAIESSAV
jgi:DHA1 family tetracycline resistance protein-like MFS transporter